MISGLGLSQAGNAILVAHHPSPEFKPEREKVHVWAKLEKVQRQVKTEKVQ